MNPHSIWQIAYSPVGESETGGGSDTAGTFSQAKQTITASARETAARLKSAASDTASRAKSEAQRFAAEKKAAAASRLGGYGSVMHESASSIEQQDPNIAWATHRVADRIEDVADYLRKSDLSDLKMDAENFARQHPIAFFGGLFIGGLVIGNLLKARRRSELAENEASDWDSGDADGDGTASGLPTANGL